MHAQFRVEIVRRTFESKRRCRPKRESRAWGSGASVQSLRGYCSPIAFEWRGPERFSIIRTAAL
jgi:hypothetical protein